MTGERLKSDLCTVPGTDDTQWAHQQLTLGPQEQDHEQEQFLVNSEILEMIMDQLEFCRQKICRLVSRSWNQELCRMFGVRGVSVYLGGKGEAERFVGVLQGRRELARALPSPFSNTSLVIKTLAGDSMDFCNILTECPGGAVTELRVIPSDAKALPKAPPAGFLKMMAPSLTTLDSACWTPMPDFSNLSFPKLESISIVALSPEQVARIFDSSGSQAAELKFWSCLIESAPNLSHLKIRGGAFSERLLEVISSSRGRKSLEAISLFFSKTNYEAQILTLRLLASQTTYNLSEFTVSCNMRENGMCDWIHRIIARFSATLNSLCIMNYFKELPWRDIPNCPSLRQLRLGILDVTSFPWRNVPRLRSLYAMSILISSPRRRVKHPCTSVRRVGLREFADHESWSTLFKFFPGAAHWKLQGIGLVPDFCAAAQYFNANIRRVSLVPGFARVKLAHGPDLTSSLKKLRGLTELDIYEADDSMLRAWPFTFDYALTPLWIRFCDLPGIQILRWRLPLEDKDALPNLKTLSSHLSLLARVELVGRSSEPAWESYMQELVVELPGALRVQSIGRVTDDNTYHWLF